MGAFRSGNCGSLVCVASVCVLAAVAALSGCSSGSASGSTQTQPRVAATPAFSVGAGTYTSGQSVALTDTTTGAQIFYTTDGSTPTAASTPYTGPISINASVTLKAIATAAGFSPSVSASAAYTIGFSAPLSGTVTSSTRPIANAHVYLFAAGTSGYGEASVSLLNAAQTGHADAIGAYVLTASDGTFNLTGDYVCSAGSQLYLYSNGGDTGSGTNPGIGLLAVIGYCPTSSAALYAHVNAVTTIAGAYATAGFAVDATHISSSGTTLATTGVANAFATAANLATFATGAGLTITPAGNGSVPQAAINTLANILTSCVENASACATLFSAATADGTGAGISPTDTATAAINIAHHPAQNIAALYALAASARYTPALSSAPNDWTVAVSFTAGGLSASFGIAVDGSGNIWVANISTNSVTEISPLGIPLSGSLGYQGGNLNNPTSVAIDLSGNAWVSNDVLGTVVKLTSTGSASSDPGGYPVGTVPYAVAIDGSGNIWVVNEISTSVSELSASTGASIGGASLTTGRSLPNAIAIDTSGSAWIANLQSTTVVKISSTGATTLSSNGTQTGTDGVAIDSSGNVWLANGGSSTLTKLTGLGATVGSYTAGGINQPGVLAIDGAGNVWAPNQATNSLSELTNSGIALSPANGFKGGGLSTPAAATVDGSGNVWVSNSGDRVISEFVGVATPVVTPLALGVKNHMLGTRP